MSDLETAPLVPGDAEEVATIVRAERAPARGLYEHVGMHVTRTSWEYAKLL